MTTTALLLLFFLFLQILHGGQVPSTLDVANIRTKSLPIVYVYSALKERCADVVLLGYIEITLRQAVLTQSNADIILVSNYEECAALKTIADAVPEVKQVEVKHVVSQRTEGFMNNSMTLFTSNVKEKYDSELWITSAVRFFILEDL